MKLISHDELHRRWMQDPVYRAAYEAEEKAEHHSTTTPGNQNKNEFPPLPDSNLSANARKRT